MFIARSFLYCGLIFGIILPMCDSLWAKKKVSIVVWLDKEQTFAQFQPVAQMDTLFATWINEDSINVKLIRHSQVLELFNKKNKSKATSITRDCLLTQKPTHLLVVRPLYTSVNILSGTIDLHKNGEPEPTASVFFGGDRKDLAQVIFEKVKSLIPASDLQRKCYRDGIPCDQIKTAHRAQAIITGIAILWTFCAPEYTSPKLPLPKPLPDVP